MYQDRLKRTPLHKLLYRSPPQDIIQKFIKYAPQSIKMKDVFGQLPIHSSIRASPEVVQALLNSSESAKLTDDQGRSPIHNACLFVLSPLHKPYWNEESFRILNMLVEFYPKGINQNDNHGTTPLGLLKQEKYAEKKSDNGMLPLHHVCKSDSLLYLVHFLIKAYPAGLTVPDNDGQTPSQYLNAAASRRDTRGMALLHRQAAQSKGLSVIIFHILLNAYPEAIQLTDKSGLLPLHHACLNEMSSLDVIMLFVKCYPESIVA
mmetsp:Transcript_25636/g.36754  ORF Transcript_25636/g.36754 Transcript_25636/m.36754 type:complete len:262 (-) Transcript_25636:226-1011(-)